MKTASWILLALAGALTIIGGLVSLSVAFRSPEDQIGPVSLAELVAGRPDVEVALRGRRATAAAYATGFGTLFLAITLGPYRRGDAWAWWTLFVGTLVVSALILLRVPFLGTRLGIATALIQLGVVGLGLALGAGRLRSAPPPI
jgi:hypothetical protein